MTDNFGDRMKAYERQETGRRFMTSLPVYARIDGRSFNKFKKGMDRPFDIKMSAVILATTKYLVEQTHAYIGYTQSDEISLCWFTESPDSQIFFDGKIQKMVSVLAGMASTSFFMNYLNLFSKSSDDYYINSQKLPCFDARVFQLPSKMECANAFLWREFDATKNSISMAARSVYSHKELDRRNGSEMQEMLWQKGINWNEYPAFFKRGTFVQRKPKWVELDAETLAKIPEDRRPTGPVQRHEIVELEMPPFAKVTNRVEVIFDSADPITEGDE